VSATVSVPDSPRWLGRLFSGRPHQTITTGGTTYLRRWFLCPPNRWLNCYLHHFVGSDDPTALHDHPWWFMSICLQNGYLEISQNATTLRRPGTIAVRRARHRHRIALLANPDGAERGCWTILVTGAHVRQWGFLVPPAQRWPAIRALAAVRRRRLPPWPARASFATARAATTLATQRLGITNGRYTALPQLHGC
jgi:hypothetical protein